MCHYCLLSPGLWAGACFGTEGLWCIGGLRDLLNCGASQVHSTTTHTVIIILECSSDCGSTVGRDGEELRGSQSDDSAAASEGLAHIHVPKFLNKEVQVELPSSRSPEHCRGFSRRPHPPPEHLREISRHPRHPSSHPSSVQRSGLPSSALGPRVPSSTLGPGLLNPFMDSPSLIVSLQTRFFMGASSSLVGLQDFYANAGLQEFYMDIGIQLFCIPGASPQGSGQSTTDNRHGFAFSTAGLQGSVFATAGLHSALHSTLCAAGLQVLVFACRQDFCATITGHWSPDLHAFTE
ncbi:hypothetical protein CRENBAI_018649 [Crenichthys baileyi]|uniref:Uncharacterized protein n=1 Tax=Crenichthys baileyi TaxID=28760 RepID=A0AAV9S3Z5_9TELE